MYLWEIMVRVNHDLNNFRRRLSDLAVGPSAHVLTDVGPHLRS